MKRVTLGTTMITPPMVVLAMSLYGATALPPVQNLPSLERPFVFTHVAKTGGSSLREVIVDGALTVGVPSEHIYIPCYEGLECNTTTIPAKPLSVIAGHFSHAELEHVGTGEMDCMVSMREPIDRATSCLFFFHREAMDEVAQMTEEEFRKVALEDTACNNMAAAMLMSHLPGVDGMAVNRASLNASLSEAITASALANLERCVVVNHLDVSHGQVWAMWAPLFLATWFPWTTANNTAIPHYQINYKPYRLPYRLVKVLEDLNSVDMLLYNRSAELMLMQLGFATTKGCRTRQGGEAHARAAPPELAGEACPEPPLETQSRGDSTERISSKHGVSRRALSVL